MLTVKHLAAVAVSSTNFGFDRRYKYIIPVEMEEKVFVGARVLVPFGKGNRKRVAVVIRIDDSANEDLSLFKPINSIIDSEPLLNEEMLDLMMWIRNTTMCTYFEAFKTLIPIG
ncbi:MAG: primosomal protein N', partial [Oscillospiraceae bacterium]|nr:primosomal protein N' [Oscillospiraceae bacterium]